jgi:hypothetical protein
MAKGSCNCGAVQYEIDHVIDYLYACHCSICRKWSGAQGVVVALVPNSTFRWVQGQDSLAHWSKPDADWASCFCNTCGSAMPGPNDAGTMFIPAGSLTEGADGLQISDHIFIGSKADWDQIGDNGRQHLDAYEP